MPEDNILSEEEMTDLAGRGERDESDSRRQLYPGGEVLLYDFKQPEHTKQSHFPTLQIINEKTLAGFRHKLETMLQQKVEAGVQEIHINSFGEFVHALNIPVDIKKVYVPKLNGSFLVCFDEGLITSIVEDYFGAPLIEHKPARSKKAVQNNKGQDNKKQQDKSADEDQGGHADVYAKEAFTNAESRISHKILNFLLASMQNAWQLLDNYCFEYRQTENNPRLINYLDHAELIVNMNFEVKIRERPGIIRVGMPYKMLDRVKHQLRRVAQDRQAAHDQKWLARLYEKIQTAPMEIVGELGRLVIPVSRLAELKAGDTLRMPKPEHITVYVDKTPVLIGHIGESNGQTAIQVSQWLKPESKNN